MTLGLRSTFGKSLTFAGHLRAIQVMHTIIAMADHFPALYARLRSHHAPDLRVRLSACRTYVIEDGAVVFLESFYW
jgi:hypothetical protein